MKNLKIETTPLIGVVKFFSFEKKFGFAVINGEDHYFNLAGLSRAAIRFNNNYPVLMLYVGVGEIIGENFYFPKKGDKIFVLGQRGTKVTFWTSEKEFLIYLKILEKLKNKEEQEGFSSKNEDSFGCKWMAKRVIYTKEKEIILRDGYIRKIDLENGVAVPLGNDYPNFFIIQELIDKENGVYFYNEKLKKYELVVGG